MKGRVKLRSTGSPARGQPRLYICCPVLRDRCPDARWETSGFPVLSVSSLRFWLEREILEVLFEAESRESSNQSPGS